MAMNRVTFEREMWELGDSFDDGRVDIASDITAALIRNQIAGVSPEENVNDLLRRVDSWIVGHNIDEAEDERWLNEFL